MLGNISFNGSDSEYVNKKMLAIIILPFHFFISYYGNGFLVFALLKVKGSWNSVNTMIFNISICNLVITSIPSLSNILEMMWNRWLLTAGFCYFSTFTQYLFMVASHFMCVTIAYERYRAITDPLKQLTSTQWHGKFAIAAVWLFAISIAIFTTVIHTPEVSIGVNQEACLNTWIHFTYQNRNAYAVGAITLSILLFILPMTYMTVIYTILVIKLCKRRLPGDNRSKRVTIKAQKQNLSIAVMLLITVVLYQAFWMPTVVLQIAFHTIFKGKLNRQVTDLDSLSSTVAFCYCALSPWIYICFNKVFRDSITAPCYKKDGGDKERKTNRQQTVTTNFISPDQMITSL